MVAQGGFKGVDATDEGGDNCIGRLLLLIPIASRFLLL
jgi:hypothetical protein